jgi:hypothetical protein
MIQELLLDSPVLKKLLMLCQLEYDGNLAISTPTAEFECLLLPYSKELLSRHHGNVSIVRPDGNSANLAELSIGRI